MNEQGAYREAEKRWPGKAVVVQEHVTAPSGSFTIYLVGCVCHDFFSWDARGVGRSWAEAFARADQREPTRRVRR